jgi:nicotinamide mononucleotide transporter
VGSSLVEWVAVALALAYVLLATRQSRWCWPAAGASSLIYLVLFARAGLPMQAALQVFYVVMAVYGWIAWRVSHGQATQLRVSGWPLRRHLYALGLVVAATLANVRLIGGDAQSIVPYADALVAWGSVAATWLMTRKVLENWLYWIAFDLVAAALYLSQGFEATAGLFIVYVALAVRGYLEWRRDLAREAPGEAAVGMAMTTAVRAALAGQAATLDLVDAVLEPVRGGLSNHCWKAQQDGRHWFVRLGGLDSAALGVDRLSEQALLTIAGSAGLAPQVLACDPSNGLLVTPFIQGATWRREDARQLRNIERIAERLRVLHGLEAPAAVRIVDFAAQARSLEAQLRAAAVPHGSGSAASDDGTGDSLETAVRVRCTVDAAFTLLAERRPRLVPCHNDLHHLNLLDDGRRLWLVDWEYGGLGDPLFDLASYACQHEFGPAERARLLDAYLAGGVLGPPARELPAPVAAGPGNAAPYKAALDAACTAFDYVQWLWYRLWAARNPESGEEYASRAAQIATRLLAGGS